MNANDTTTATTTTTGMMAIAEYRRTGRVPASLYGDMLAVRIQIGLERLGRRRTLPCTLDRLAEIIDAEAAAYRAEQDRRDRIGREWLAAHSEAFAAAMAGVPEVEPQARRVVSRTPVTAATGRAMALDVGFDLHAAGVQYIIHDEPDAADADRYGRDRAARDAAVAVARLHADSVCGDRPTFSGCDMTDYDIAGRIVAAATA